MARIMVVDDVASIRQIVSAMLQEVGHRVLDAGSAAEALAHARIKRVHLVITDINMPGMSGLELIKGLRGVEGYGTTPILVMAKDANDENIEKAREIGACGYVMKPFTPDKFVAVVNQILVDNYVT